MYNIGDKISFSLPGSDQLIHNELDYIGKALILYTYPRDSTPGCTLEANGFKDLYHEFEKYNAVVLGVNNNSLSSHQRFIDKYCLPFPLLIDEELTLIKQLKADKEDTKVSRKTYIIDENGILERVYDKVSPSTHPTEVLEYIKTRKK